MNNKVYTKRIWIKFWHRSLQHQRITTCVNGSPSRQRIWILNLAVQPKSRKWSFEGPGGLGPTVLQQFMTQPCSSCNIWQPGTTFIPHTSRRQSFRRTWWMYWEMSPDVSTNFRVSWFSKGKDMVYLNHMSLSENTAKYLFNQVLNPPKPTPQIPNSHFFPFLLFNCLLSMSEKQLVR